MTQEKSEINGAGVIETQYSSPVQIDVMTVESVYYITEHLLEAYNYVSQGIVPEEKNSRKDDFNALEGILKGIHENPTTYTISARVDQNGHRKLRIGNQDNGICIVVTLQNDLEEANLALQKYQVVRVDLEDMASAGDGKTDTRGKKYVGFRVVRHLKTKDGKPRDHNEANNPIVLMYQFIYSESDRARVDFKKAPRNLNGEEYTVTHYLSASKFNTLMRSFGDVYDTVPKRAIEVAALTTVATAALEDASPVLGGRLDKLSLDDIDTQDEAPVHNIFEEDDQDMYKVRKRTRDRQGKGFRRFKPLD